MIGGDGKEGGRKEARGKGGEITKDTTAQTDGDTRTAPSARPASVYRGISPSWCAGGARRLGLVLLCCSSCVSAPLSPIIVPALKIKHWNGFGQESLASKGEKLTSVFRCLACP